MNILLVSGGMHQIISGYVPQKVEIVNAKPLLLSEVQKFFRESNANVHAVLLTDEAILQRGLQEDLSSLLDFLSIQLSSPFQLLYITRESWQEKELELLSGKYEAFYYLISRDRRVPIPLYRQGFEQLVAKYKGIRKRPAYDDVQMNQGTIEQAEPEQPKEGKMRSFFERFKLKSSAQSEIQVTDQLTKDIEKISRGISRVVAITGHRGSGLTSTAVNVASEASKRGLQVMVVDMDTDYRSTNMYFSSFHEGTKKDEEINASLIRTLARPQDYLTTAFHLKENLWLASLGYHFQDRRLIDQFYNSAKLIGLLSMLRSRFNLVLLDIPLDSLTNFQEALVHIDVFGLCVPNNLYAILSTARNIEAALEKEQAKYLNAKARLIVTKYNSLSRFKNDFFTPDHVSQILASGLVESLVYEMQVAGQVPYTQDFDAQIETDVPLVLSSTEHARAYGSILLRLMEGAK